MIDNKSPSTSGSGLIDTKNPSTSSSDLLENPALINELALRVAKHMTNKQSGAGSPISFPSVIPNWKYYERVQPTVVTTAVPNTTPPTHFSNPLFENDLNDSFDENALLKRVPKLFKKKASLLLKAFDERANEITWDAAGNIYIDEQVLPNANIYQLFPYLFRKKSPKNLQGLSDLVQKLNTMGLSHLFNCKVEKLKVASQVLSGEGESETNWWYLGP